MFSCLLHVIILLKYMAHTLPHARGGAGGGAGGPTNILARQSSNSDVIDFVTLLLLHKA